MMRRRPASESRAFRRSLRHCATLFTRRLASAFASCRWRKRNWPDFEIKLEVRCGSVVIAARRPARAVAFDSAAGKMRGFPRIVHFWEVGFVTGSLGKHPKALTIG